jgi:hypothetical protein
VRASCAIKVMIRSIDGIQVNKTDLLNKSVSRCSGNRCLLSVDRCAPKHAHNPTATHIHHPINDGKSMATACVRVCVCGCVNEWKSPKCVEST